MAGNFMKTLNSKSIARTLRQMYGMRYIPRPRDLPHEHHPNEDIEGQNMNPPVYNQFTQWAQPQQKIQWNQNPHQSKLNKIQNTRIHEVSPNTNQNYLSWQYPKETNAAYHQARSQDRRRSKEQTVNANFFPLAQNPPPFPFNSQNNNLSTINPNSSKPQYHIPMPPTINQHQQMQYQQYQRFPDQRPYNQQWVTQFQNTPSPYPYQAHPNVVYQAYVQQPNASSHYYTNSQAHPTMNQHQQTRQQECIFANQPPGGKHNHK